MQIALLVVAVLLVLIALYFVMRPKPPRSLYDRLGGVYPIAAVVSYFSDSLLSNPVVGVDSKNPQLRAWHRKEANPETQSRLPGLKFMRTLWLCDAAGGPFKFESSVGAPGLNLQKKHCPFKITSAEFDAVAQELSQALDHFKVPAKEKQEVLAAFAAHKGEVIFCSK